MNSQRTFFLHVGGHKTGSTALQKFLDDNRVALSRKGYCWPETGKRTDVTESWGHHELAWTLRDGDSKGLWHRLMQETSGTASVVASSEEFSLFRQPSKFAPVTAVLDGIRVRPILYLRKQDQLLESIYKHHVKALGEVQPIMEFAERVWFRLDHLALVNCLGEVFGRENLILRVYEPDHVDGNIYTDFLKTLGLSNHRRFQKPGFAMNPSLSSNGIEAMLEANRQYSEDEKQLTAIRQAIVKKHQARPWTPHGILSDEERSRIEQIFREGNQTIAREFFGRDELF